MKFGSEDEAYPFRLLKVTAGVRLVRLVGWQVRWRKPEECRERCKCRVVCRLVSFFCLETAVR